MVENEIINKVAQSGLITLDPADYLDKTEKTVFDLKECLFMGMILKEKDFREFVKNHDWSVYAGKNVAVTCSADAIVPMWSYMLVAIHLQPYAKSLVYGTRSELETELYKKALDEIDFSQYADKKVIVKGCGDQAVPASAYLMITEKLRPYASKIMYGEACSMVPLYSKAKN